MLLADLSHGEIMTGTVIIQGEERNFFNIEYSEILI